MQIKITRWPVAIILGPGDSGQPHLDITDTGSKIPKEITSERPGVRDGAHEMQSTPHMDGGIRSVFQS